MQNILVTSDLSERSRPAIARVVNLAVDRGAELDVLSVVNEDVPDTLSRALELGAAAILKEQVEEDLQGRALTYRIQVETGDPLALISERAAQDDVHLLVVGAHRRRRFLDQVRETTVEHIIRSSRTPVLMVSTDYGGPYGSVLAGTAFSKTCRSLVKMIPQVASGAALALFHAHAVSFRNEAANEFDTWTSVYGLPKTLPEPVFYEGPPQDAVATLMAAGTYDLLAIGGHTKADGGRYFTGRFTADLVRTPPCDLLIAK